MRVKVLPKIKIGVYSFGLHLCPHIRDDEGYTGFTNFRTEEIAILPQLAARRKDATLLHELIHVFEDVYHFNIPEETNWRIAEGMAEFLYNNLGIEFDWSDIEEK